MIKIVKPNLMLKIIGKENATGLQFTFDTALQRTEEWTLVAIKLHALLKVIYRVFNGAITKGNGAR